MKSNSGEALSPGRGGGDQSWILSRGLEDKGHGGGFSVSLQVVVVRPLNKSDVHLAQRRKLGAHKVPA